MNSMHDPHVHNKRTSINELLNPVSATSSSLGHPYGRQQLPSLSAALQYSQHHHLPPPSQYSQHPPPQINPGPQFSLRAANWESSKDELGPAGRSESDAAPCRYSSSSSAPSHPMYADTYPRHARPVEDTPHYSMEATQSWSSSHETPSASYGAPMMSPVYSDERAAASGEDMSRGAPYPPPQAPPQSHPQYEQEMPPPQLHSHASYITNAYLSYYTHAPPTPRGGPPSMAVHPQNHGPTSPQAYYPAPVNMAFAAIPIAAPPPAMLQQHPKRAPEPSEEEQVGPRAKKAKATKSKAPESSVSSRRAYNQKKRNEAAQGSAQNAPVMLYAHASDGAGKEKASGSNAPSYGAMRIVAEDANSNPDTAGPLQPELQFARCMSNRYRSEEFPRCVSCTRRWAGDTCRFQGIRFFLKNQNRDIVGISFVESQKPDAPTMNFPNKWNINLEMDHIYRVKRTVAVALLPILKQEMQHLSLPEIIRRPRESEVRATCDTCMTSIFSSSWMCRLCGREACAECFEQVKELTTDRVGAPEAEIAALQARREKHAHVNPFFLSCTRRHEHQAKDFSPMSRFCKTELTQAIEEMEALAKRPPAADQESSDESQFRMVKSPPKTPRDVWGNASPSSSSSLAVGDVVKVTESSSFVSASASSASSASSGSSIPSHETITFADAELTDEKFRRAWEKGLPLVVNGLLSKFHLQWTPEYFSSKYGTQSCLILECQTEQNKRVTVAEFFSLFGKYEGRRDCWKLKDWPPSTDFKTAFPELFDDFSRATPVPNYVRRDGVLNIASHFPSNAIAPDLGPKMYNAMASFESQGSKGSTRLHMDMADAINIMAYASPTPDGRPGCAAWDIFRAEDTPKLRKFLRKKFKGQYQHDPIHSQQFYLDSTLRQELYKDYGVHSHRIYQRPGEAVLVPAGCAHQVCNLADCIKVACDFVSPENIARCEILTREFREQNQSMAWKEDVLQLRTMMWFAWLSCVRQEKEMLEG
ncbi:Clavaminate synthase-like protein [Dichomitus squalens]|uniref:Clavaminate synthase-like protein n=1 Tax=Dichomitus squalens TaxID=114155 RepID=A0A4Q9MZG0_9APHY|nr:Clavaminate synthase-like protein [Dichomitus squalens]